MDRDLSGSVALVTGAARNLGAVTAEMLGARGATVVVHHHDAASAESAETVVRRIAASGGEAVATEADLADPAAVDRLTGFMDDRFGRYDILVNNAGVMVKRPWAELEAADWDRAFHVNARAPFLLMRHAATALNDGGRVVNIGTSILGMSIGWYTLYAASKAALEHYGRAFAHEFKARRITANTVAPGSFETPFFHAAETPETVAMIRQMTGGLGEVADVVPLIRFLTSEESRWLSGQTLFVNGGFLAR